MKTYGTEPGAPTPVQVGISELVVSDGDDTLKSYGLGSCLAIALYDPGSGIGGLAHVMLPDGDAADNSDRKPGKYADTAIRALLRRMVEQGANYTTVEAKIAGGSDMFEFESFERASASETSPPRRANSRSSASRSRRKTSVGNTVGPSNSRRERECSPSRPRTATTE